MKIAVLTGHIGVQYQMEQILSVLEYDYDVYFYGTNLDKFKEDWFVRRDNSSLVTDDMEVQLLEKLKVVMGLDCSEYDAIFVDFFTFTLGALLKSNKKIIFYPCLGAEHYNTGYFDYWKLLKLHNKDNFKFVVLNELRASGYRRVFQDIYPELNVIIAPFGVDPKIFEPYSGDDMAVFSLMGAIKSRFGLEWDKVKYAVNNHNHIIAGAANEDVGGVFMPRETVLDHLKNCRVCFNAFSDRASFAFAEVLMSGIPLVTLPVNQPKDHLADGVNVIMSNDVDYLKENIDRLIADKDFAMKIGTAGKQVAMEKFNLRNDIEGWIDIFK